jgi:hypothetical protein
MEAAGAGHLHILQWARENGCDWDSYTCSLAAREGNWDIVVWAVKNGVQMERDNDDDDDDDEGSHFNLCEFASEADRWDIVQLAIDFGCTCSDDTRRILRFLYQLGSVLN